MNSPTSQSIARQLHDLETFLRSEGGPFPETPEGNFARHVFEAVREAGPMADWGPPPPEETLRRGMAPDLAAFGYRIASHRGAPAAESRYAWEAGLRRLSQREPFTADRQTFVFRPIEIFGLALGFSRSPALAGDLRDWLGRIFETLGGEYSHDDWAGPLNATASRLAGTPWMSREGQGSSGKPTIDGFALSKWLSIAYADPTGNNIDEGQDRELLRRALLEAFVPRDIARASVLFQAIRRTSNERLESDLATSWQLDRPTRDAIAIVTSLCRRFHQFALQLQVRHAGRPTLKFEDEYDVQDSLHALLRLHFEDVRAEEWTPSYAGNSTRMDFLLKREHIVVEAKMTRKTLKQKEVAEQLIQDKERYRSHPDCRDLVCFVYDPGHVLANPTALEDDLSTAEGNLRTIVIVSPKG